MMQFRRILPAVSFAVLFAVNVSAQTGTVPGSQNTPQNTPPNTPQDTQNPRRIGPFGPGWHQPPLAPQKPAQKGERIIYSPTIQQMKLLTSTSGWALADSQTIYWTDDDGAHWKDITPPNVASGRYRTPPFERVFFLDRDTGWALAKNYLEAGDFGSFDLYATSNGGETWTKTHIAESDSDPGSMNAFDGNAWMSFVDADHGWLNMEFASSSAFEFGQTLSTADGGQNWNFVTGDPGIGGKVLLVTEKDGWVAGGPADTELHATHDGGNTFQQVTLDAPKKLGPVNNPTYTSPIFEDSRHGFEAVTFSGPNPLKSVAVLFATTDAGRTWKLAASLSNLPESSMGQTAVSTVADATWIIPFTPRGTQPKLVELTSHDQAEAAGHLSSDYFGDHRISFATATEGWLTSGNRLLATTDGGATWTEITPGKRPTDWFRMGNAPATPPASARSASTPIARAPRTNPPSASTTVPSSIPVVLSPAGVDQ